MAKKIPTKNYVILFGIAVLIICACFAFYNVYNEVKDNNISSSPLSTHQVLYEDLTDTTVEMNADTLLLVSYVQDEEVHNNEKEIRKMLNKKNLLDNVLYLDVTEYKDRDNFIEELNKTLKLEDKLKIDKIPAIIYYKDGIPTITIDSKNHLVNVGDFEHIIDMYQLAS